MKRHFPKIRLFDQTGLSKDTIRTLNLIIAAMMGGMAWGNITGGFVMTSYLTSLGTSDLLVGVTVALPPIFNSFQFVASYLLERWLPRKKTFIVVGLIQRSVWIPFGLVPFFVPMEQAAIRIWIAVILAMISAGTMPLFNSALYSIFSDVVPMRIRGRYFAVRYRIAMVMSVCAGLLIGALLNAIPGHPGYAIAFCIAGGLGVADICCFIFMKLPPMRHSDSPMRIKQMIGRVLANKNYMRIVMFGTLWCFGVGLAGPFYNVYADKEMHMSALQLTVYAQVVSNIFSMLAITLWGRGYDRFGTRSLLLVNVLLSSLAPLVWVFIQPGMLWMVVLVNMMSGSTFAAYEIGVQNLFMGQAPEEGRTMYIAMYFLGTQLLGTALGNAVGGWLLDNPLAALAATGWSLGSFQPTRYNYIFLLCFLVRFAACWLLLAVREEGSVGFAELLSAVKQGGGNLKMRARVARQQRKNKKIRRMSA